VSRAVSGDPWVRLGDTRYGPGLAAALSGLVREEGAPAPRREAGTGANDVGSERAAATGRLVARQTILVEVHRVAEALFESDEVAVLANVDA
jgi:hypothetical protein